MTNKTPAEPRTRTSTQRLRAFWLTIHRWLGIVITALMLLLGLTGSFNVYHRQIDAWMFPNLFWAPSQGQRLPLEAILKKAAEVDPEPVISILMPDVDRTSIIVQHRHKGEVWRTFLDPVSGQVLGRRDQTHSLVNTIYRLHENLLLKDYWGEELVGIGGLALFISCASGLYLWWPRKGSWRKAVSLTLEQRKLGRWLLDLHNFFGFWSSLVLLLVAFSGFTLVFPRAVRSVVRIASPVRSTRPPEIEPLDRVGASADEILAIALQARPHDTPMVVVLPNNKDAKGWRVVMRPATSHRAVGGLTQLWIDPWRRTIVSERAPDTVSRGEWFMSHQLALHNGALLGSGGQFVVFLSGFALPTLALTGLGIYLNRRRLQQHAQRSREQRRG